jgi:hypothetical protein
MTGSFLHGLPRNQVSKKPGHVQAATPEEWADVGEYVRRFMLASGYRSEEVVKKHLGSLSGYLLWRHRCGLVLDAEAAMTHEAVDDYYRLGLDDHVKRTRGDYRSRLQNLASRVNPGLTAPSITTEGYVSVKPGYSPGEEATIRRVALRQRNTAARRKTCAVVGFCGGAGLSPKELSRTDRSHIDDRGAPHPIRIRVQGENARTVIVRRDYEELVRTAIADLAPGQLILGKVRGRSGASSAAIEDAEVFDDCPRIDARRLRTTWLTWLVTNHVPLNVIMSASGLKSARSLTDIIAALPPIDPTSALRDGSER